MYDTDAERPIHQEIDFDETDFEFSTYIRPQFKDANDFGRVCRALAIPGENWRGTHNDLAPGYQEERI